MSTSTPVQTLIQTLELQPHPEGGYFRETWRSPITLPTSALPPGYPGDRSAGTAILFLLPTGARSRLHRVRSDELWFHHAGDPIQLGIRPAQNAESKIYQLGQDHCYQVLVPGGSWQEAEALPGSAGYGLVACIVVPGFDFADFELIQHG